MPIVIVTVTHSRSAFASLLLIGSYACDENFGAVCGEGTIETKAGQCIVAPIECGEGTRQEKNTCVPSAAVLTCGTGTRMMGAECVPTSTTTGTSTITRLCGEGTVLEGNTCISQLECGPGTVEEQGACVPVISIETPGVEGMRAYACRAQRCSASSAVYYWNKYVSTLDGSTWDDHAVTRTITVVEVGARVGPSGNEFDALFYRVTDGAGGSWDCTGGAHCPGLDFEIGRPVTLTMVNPPTNIAVHYLTAPHFFRAVAWRSVTTVDAEYRAPVFDSVKALVSATEPHMLQLSFVPMAAGAFHSYCEIAVANGGRYSELVAGTLEPNFASGHAGFGLHTRITVTDAAQLFDGHSLFSDALVDRNPVLDADGRRATNWWRTPAVNLGKCCPIVNLEFGELSESEFSYRAGGVDVDEQNPIQLTVDWGHQLTMHNASTERSHYFIAPELLSHSVMRMAADTQAEVRAPYLFGLGVRPTRTADLYIVPTVPGYYHPYCDIGVTSGKYNAPDLVTGHSGSGMTGPLVVATSTSGT